MWAPIMAGMGFSLHASSWALTVSNSTPSAAVAALPLAARAAPAEVGTLGVGTRQPRSKSSTGPSKDMASTQSQSLRPSAPFRQPGQEGQLEGQALFVPSVTRHSRRSLQPPTPTREMQRSSGEQALGAPGVRQSTLQKAPVLPSRQLGQSGQ